MQKNWRRKKGKSKFSKQSIKCSSVFAKMHCNFIWNTIPRYLHKKGEQLENHKEKQTSKTQYDQNYFTQVRFNSYKTWICKHYIYKVGKPPTWCKTIISQDKNGRISFQLEKPGPSCREAIVLHDWTRRGFVSEWVQFKYNSSFFETILHFLSTILHFWE